MPLLWMQPEITTGTSSSGTRATTEAAPRGAPTNPMMGCATNAGMFAVIIALFYFLTIRPQQKKQKEHDALLKSLKRGTNVRTSGGIRGEIVDVGEQDVTLIIADKVKVTIARSHIASVETPAGSATT